MPTLQREHVQSVFRHSRIELSLPPLNTLPIYSISSQASKLNLAALSDNASSSGPARDVHLLVRQEIKPSMSLPEQMNP